jgi:DNA-directed RNA polymerase subunit RPC12/RpoP
MLPGSRLSPRRKQVSILLWMNADILKNLKKGDMVCPYCGAGSPYVVYLDDEEVYYCFECGARFRH